MNASKASLSFATAAAIFAMSTVTVSAPASAADAKPVPCYGVNACKGMSDCKTAKNECKGQNECKGHGFKDMSAQACAAQGGSLTAK